MASADSVVFLSIIEAFVHCSVISDKGIPLRAKLVFFYGFGVSVLSLMTFPIFTLVKQKVVEAGLKVAPFVTPSSCP